MAESAYARRMKNLIGLLLVLGVAIGAVLGAAELFDLPTGATAMLCFGVGMAATAIYDARFGVR